MNDAVRNKVAELLPAMIACRRDLHKHAEPAWREFRTASLAAGRLRELGYKLTLGADAVAKKAMMGVPDEAFLKEEVKRAVRQGADPSLTAKMDGGLTGFWADLDFDGGPGPRFAVRCDLDCNDVEETDDPGHQPNREGFCSVNRGCMHACGHDGHVAVNLAVAEILAGMKDELRGAVRFIFQPGEEGCRGAAPMVEAGCVRGVDLIAGMHLGFQAGRSGEIVCGAKGFLATTKWDVRIIGKAAHAGAAPQEGKNALLAACAATTNLHAIARHGAGATRVTVGRLEGGQGRNVIPPNAFMALETRGATSELDDYMTRETARVIGAACAMWDCSHEITVMGGTKSGESSPAMVERVAEIARAMPVFTSIVGMKDFGASEDYSHMMTVVQENGGLGVYIQVGVDRKAGHHNSHFDFDESGLAPAAEVLVRLVYSYLRGNPGEKFL
ncbi:MAG: amidohydrolase [Desulfovibrio sp.]|jgi:aminobenzoyl-glutamate utilization protein A|nr:amidohydrolase [Desulfovibrio sp.]